jgi:hypothetical protein
MHPATDKMQALPVSPHRPEDHQIAAAADAACVFPQYRGRFNRQDLALPPYGRRAQFQTKGRRVAALTSAVAALLQQPDRPSSWLQWPGIAAPTPSAYDTRSITGVAYLA